MGRGLMGKVVVARTIMILIEATEEEALTLVEGLSFLLNDNRGSQFIGELRNAIVDQVEC